jgi:hypothetical protein
MVKIKDLTEIKNLYTFTPGTIWYVPDQTVTMTRKKGEEGKKRPVLIVCHQDLIKDINFPIYNIIPLSRDGEPDRYSFPIDNKYSDLSGTFKPSKKSLAILPYYQPIKKESFIEYCGKLEETCYQSIVHTLCAEIIGYDDYDLDAD